MDMIAPVGNILYRHFGRHTQCMWTHYRWHWIHTQQLLHSVHITGGSGHERTPQSVDKPPRREEEDTHKNTSTPDPAPRPEL